VKSDLEIARGFTLIELIAVMIIVAILGVMAIPQFFDLRVGAGDGKAADIGGRIAAASQQNHSRGVSSGAGATVTGCSAAELGALLAGGSIPAGYSVGGVAGGLASGQIRTCTLTYTGTAGTSAQSFNIMGCANANCN
jgi:prepilin-type N-terminal cleavage/methylation domain-containing protein